ncbi:unnamed protein product [Fraxinus pennsylvanica]|uniref:Uncharacterized protein n=1 Tax=Fraxinus pennsylvanica TaxID=56036 RepID=A0AAD2E9N1_9LAMI|nr:unnamed protein product [Fraxinus pennsylvanica]
MVRAYKRGGAAITCKNELETINEEDLIVVSSQLRLAMISGSCHGMDWSKRPGSLEIPRVIDDFSDQEVTDSKKFMNPNEHVLVELFLLAILLMCIVAPYLAVSLNQDQMVDRNSVD